MSTLARPLFLIGTSYALESTRTSNYVYILILTVPNPWKLQYNTVRYGTVFFANKRTVQYCKCTVLYCTVIYTYRICTVPYCYLYVLLPYGTVTYRTVQYDTVRYSISTVAVYNEYVDYYMILRPTNLYFQGTCVYKPLQTPTIHI